MRSCLNINAEILTDAASKRMNGAYKVIISATLNLICLKEEIYSVMEVENILSVVIIEQCGTLCNHSIAHWRAISK